MTWYFIARIKEDRYRASNNALHEKKPYKTTHKEFENCEKLPVYSLDAEIS